MAAHLKQVCIRQEINNVIIKEGQRELVCFSKLLHSVLFILPLYCSYLKHILLTNRPSIRGKEIPKSIWATFFQVKIAFWKFCLFPPSWRARPHYLPGWRILLITWNLCFGGGGVSNFVSSLEGHLLQQKYSICLKSLKKKQGLCTCFIIWRSKVWKTEWLMEPGNQSHPIER